MDLVRSRDGSIRASKRTANKLHRALVHLEQLTEHSSDAVIAADPELRLVAWNRGAERLYGWERKDVLGREAPFLAANQRLNTICVWQRVLERGETAANCEEAHQTRDGRSLTMIVTTSPIRDGVGAIVALLSIAKDVTVVKALEDEGRRVARLEERERIAMDLHDKTLQAVHGAVLSLSAAERMCAESPQAWHDAGRQARRQLDGAIKELREYLLDLRPSDPHESRFAAGLAFILDQARLNSGLTVDVVLDERAVMLLNQHPSTDQLLAIAREAIWNAVRHADARTLSVRVSQEHGQMVMSFSDDGRGFASADHRTPGGYGLRNMSERAGLIGAKLSVASRDGRGTKVSVELPVQRLGVPVRSFGRRSTSLPG